MIQGSISYYKLRFSNNENEVILISRKSNKHGGTRFNARGIDNAGNVANFVETEQLIYFSGYCFSYVIIRGSAPIYF